MPWVGMIASVGVMVETTPLGVLIDTPLCAAATMMSSKERLYSVELEELTEMETTARPGG